MVNKNLDSPVVLLGMMGSGKTHVGRLLAQRLNLDFYDTDALIEKQQGHSVSEIFKNRGEAFFRRLEQKIIIELLGGAVSVISTGGGAITTPRVLEEVHKQAVSIWLRVDRDILIERIKRGGAKRPLLACENPEERLDALLKEREVLYSQADLTINNSHENIEIVVDEIVSALGTYKKSKDNKE